LSDRGRDCSSAVLFCCALAPCLNLVDLLDWSSSIPFCAQTTDVDKTPAAVRSCLSCRQPVNSGQLSGDGQQLRSGDPPAHLPWPAQQQQPRQRRLGIARAARLRLPGPGGRGARRDAAGRTDVPRAHGQRGRGAVVPERRPLQLQPEQAAPSGLGRHCRARAAVERAKDQADVAAAAHDPAKGRARDPVPARERGRDCGPVRAQYPRPLEHSQWTKDMLCPMRSFR